MEERKNSNFKSSIVLSLILVFGIFLPPGYSAEEAIPKIGPVKMNPHPSTLEGRTVLLRWNGKYNGDKFLSRLGEKLTEQVKIIKIVRMWEIDPGTAVISKKIEVSEQIASKINKLKPDIVIAAQAD